MISKLPLTVTIITLNEQENIAHAISSVAFAQEIIVVDSGSTDQTLEIAKKLGAKITTRAWTGYGQQKNYAQSLASFNWILNLDADESLSDRLQKEISDLFATQAHEHYAGFKMPRKTFYAGQWIRYGGWYPNYCLRLAHKNKASWTEPPVHETLKVTGPIGFLKNDILHQAFPDIKHQVLTNLNFAELGSEAIKPHWLMLKLIFKPLGKFIETYLIKRGFLDGIRGYIISINAAYSLFLKYSFAIQKRNFLNEKKNSAD